MGKNQDGVNEKESLNEVSTKLINKKLFHISALMLFLFVILTFNIFRIQVIMEKYWRNLADKQYSKSGEVEGERGKILSINGEELAYNTPSYELVIDPREIKDIDSVMKIFSENLAINYKEFRDKAKDLVIKKRGHMKISDKIGLEVKNKIVEELKNRGKNLNTGVFFLNEPSRFYPKKDSMMQIVGFTNVDDEGVFGIEKSYENYLKGEKGYEKRYVSTYIVFEMPVDKDKEIIAPEDGRNVILTIDSYMQFILEDELQKAVTENTPEWASGIILDPNTGKILAMSSLPNESLKNLKNRVISNSYEPGSVMKPVIMSMALNDKIVGRNETFYSDGQVKIHDRTIKDHDRSATGYITPRETITKSSNVVMAQIGMRFNKEKYYDYLRKFGFGEKSGIEIPGEVRGILKPLKRWDGLTPATTAFGQGISATPLQMAMATAAVINGGNLYKPIIVEKVVDGDGKIIDYSKVELKRKVISEEVSAQLRDMMWATVEEGTGKPAKIDGYDIGGKTGTSQKAVRGIYAYGQYIASFVGFYPVDKPKYLCLIMIDNPSKGNYYGGSVAAPVFKNVMQRVFKYKNILSKNIEDSTVVIDNSNQEKKVIYKLSNASGASIEAGIEYLELPDFKGLPIKDVFFAMKQYKNIDITIDGVGNVIAQEPLPGTKMDTVKGVHIVLGDIKKVEEDKKNGNSTNGALLLKKVETKTENTNKLNNKTESKSNKQKIVFTEKEVKVIEPTATKNETTNNAHVIKNNTVNTIKTNNTQDKNSPVVETKEKLKVDTEKPLNVTTKQSVILELPKIGD